MTNLRIEMLRRGISVRAVASLLKRSDAFTRKRVDGKADFTIFEAVLIRNTFFPEITIDFLFAKEAQISTVR